MRNFNLTLKCEVDKDDFFIKRAASSVDLDIDKKIVHSVSIDCDIDTEYKHYASCSIFIFL